MENEVRTFSPPRFLITAASSGSGKTTVTSGLLRCLARRGLGVVAYKCGPDYIDPMFHRSVLGTPCFNLDLFFSTPSQVRALLCERSAEADISVLEGVMGFYDGLGGRSTDASAYHVASATSTPVIAVMDARGTSMTIASLVKGLRDFRDDSNLVGVIFNRCSKMTFKMLSEIVEELCGVRAVGYMPDVPDAALESRHLGLVTAGEVEDLQAKIDKVADVLEESVDIDLLLEIARGADELEFMPSVVEPAWPAPGKEAGGAPRIAVAHDAAFCFYYEESLDYLRRLGVELIPFSPLSDARVPDDADACYLGGGYPELHARELAENEPMRASLKRRAGEGMPLFAECGGFLYLKETMTDIDGETWPMAGILPGGSGYTGHLTRFGYVELEARQGGLGIEEGDRIRAHEFHYYDSDDNGESFRAVKPVTGRSWECGVARPRLLAGFPHLYLPAAPDFARRFVEAAIAYRAERLARG